MTLWGNTRTADYKTLKHLVAELKELQQQYWDTSTADTKHEIQPLS